MSNNLAAYFANQNNTGSSNNNNVNPSFVNPNGDDDMGPSVSMAVEAENDEDFHKSTFKLKRTRSMGLLDPTNNDLSKSTSNSNPAPVSTTSNNYNNNNVNVDYNYHDDYPSDSDSSMDTSSSDDTSTSTSSDVSNDNDQQQYTDQEGDIDMNYTPSASVSPPVPDNDKYLPQDDNDVVREPQRHVDYLSHHWKESEISNSWKYIIAKKKKRDIDVVNTARLENASWRTWAKARNNLKTVSPEILNWSKDSDVTWLYGPIVRGGDKKKKNHKGSYRYDNNDDEEEDDDDDDTNNNDIGDNDDYERGYGSDGDETSIRLPSTSPSTSSHTKNMLKQGHGSSKKSVTPKPILKRRTMTEIIEENSQWKLNEARKHYNEVRNARSYMDPDAENSVHDDYDLLAAKVNAQYFNYPPKNPTNQQSNPSSENDNTSMMYHNNECSSSNTSIGQSNNVKIVDNVSSNGNEIPSYENNVHTSTSQNNDNANKIQNNEDYDNHSMTSDVPVLNTNHRNIYTVSTSNSGTDMKNGTLSSILATPSHIRLKNALTKNDNNNNDDSIPPKKNKHIHFNDRVEQCMVVKYNNPDNTSDVDMDGDFYSSDDGDYNDEFSDYSDSDTDSNSNDGDNDDEHGLFISARFARRADSIAHSPITDNSSIGSTSTNGRHHSHIRPIIKLLPATTLNYGSDEESDNSEYNGGYGNAVSHNVNTQRGYDYIYDYNSVYTGDTSNFLPVDSCDIIDVPEGIDLQTAIADDKQQQTYELLSPQIADKPALPISPVDDSDHLYSSDDQYSMSSNTDDDQFIEDSHYQDSYDDSDYDSDSGNNDEYIDNNTKPTNNNLGLKRTMSVGRSNNSLVSLSYQGSSSTSLKNSLSQSFLSGQPTNSGLQNNGVNNGNMVNQNKEGLPFKRSTSKSFIFDSDSEDDSDDNGDNLVLNHSENVPDKLQGDLNLDLLQVKPDSNPNRYPRRKLGPPQRSSSSLLLNNPRRSSPDLSKAIKIPSNTTTPADIVPSDIAIEGSFSPRNDSLKSVISKEKLMDTESYSGKIA